MTRAGAVAKDPVGGAAARVVVGALIFAATLVFEAVSANLINDHFMHVAWGRQILAGDLPLRDMVEPGTPLQAVLSAVAERVLAIVSSPKAPETGSTE